eukprot:13617642-Alexandrium_andersonii.AAC.1
MHSWPAALAARCLAAAECSPLRRGWYRFRTVCHEVRRVPNPHLAFVWVREHRGAWSRAPRVAGP